VNRLSDKFLDETIKFWQPRMRRELSREDARQIAENLSGFFRVLLEWDAQKQVCHESSPYAVSNHGELPTANVSSKLEASTT
jgi:hypothetical protein